jgi:hypothetical protein
VISTSQTTNHGVFVFKHIDADEADGVSVNIAVLIIQIKIKLNYKVPKALENRRG